jgi:hypothetical protein
MQRKLAARLNEARCRRIAAGIPLAVILVKRKCREILTPLPGAFETSRKVSGLAHRHFKHPAIVAAQYCAHLVLRKARRKQRVG